MWGCPRSCVGMELVLCESVSFIVLVGCAWWAKQIESAQLSGGRSDFSCICVRVEGCVCVSTCGGRSVVKRVQLVRVVLCELVSFRWKTLVIWHRGRLVAG